MLEMETKLTNFIKSIKMQSVISIDRVFVVLVYDLFSRWLDSRRMYAAVVDGGSLPTKHLTRPGYIFFFFYRFSFVNTLQYLCCKFELQESFHSNVFIIYPISGTLSFTKNWSSTIPPKIHLNNPTELYVCVKT